MHACCHNNEIQTDTQLKWMLHRSYFVGNNNCKTEDPINLSRIDRNSLTRRNRSIVDHKIIRIHKRNLCVWSGDEKTQQTYSSDQLHRHSATTQQRHGLSTGNYHHLFDMLNNMSVRKTENRFWVVLKEPNRPKNWHPFQTVFWQKCMQSAIQIKSDKNNLNVQFNV